MNTIIATLFLVGSLFATSTIVLVRSDANTSVNSFACNDAYSYFSSDPFGNSVAYVLADLMNETPSHETQTQQGFDFYCVSPYATAVAYGHATCGQISSNDCANCFAAARTFLMESCAMRVGARVYMVDCTMRYENYKFA